MGSSERRGTPSAAFIERRSARQNAAMTVARMWESRLDDGLVDAFFDHVARVAWPAFTTAAGFRGGEVYRSDDDGRRAVVVTRWADEASADSGAAVEAGLARFCAREPHAWVFRRVDLPTARDTPRH
jgi:heme-degrading monooxygenase HmoA